MYYAKPGTSYYTINKKIHGSKLVIYCFIENLSYNVDVQNIWPDRRIYRLFVALSCCVANSDLKSSWTWVVLLISFTDHLLNVNVNASADVCVVIMSIQC